MDSLNKLRSKTEEERRKILTGNSEDDKATQSYIRVMAKNSVYQKTNDEETANFLNSMIDQMSSEDIYKYVNDESLMQQAIRRLNKATVEVDGENVSAVDILSDETSSIYDCVLA